MSESTVNVGGMEISSNTESAEEMMEVLAPKEGDDTPKVIKDRGQEPEEKDEVSKAASELGKRGGEASAKARKEKAEAEPEEKEEAKPSDDAEKAEEKPGEEKAEESKDEDKRKGDPRFDPRARVMEATREAAEAKAEAQRLRQELEALKGGKAPEPKVPEAQAGEPSMDDYENVQDYINALVEHKVQHREKERTEQQQQAARLEMDKGRAESFQSKMLEADSEALQKVDPKLLEATPTFMLRYRPDGPKTPTPDSDIAEALTDAEDPLAVMLHLTEHPDELAKIRALPDGFAVNRAMGRLEARLMVEKRNAPPPAPTESSKAPPPIKPLSPSSVPTDPDIYSDSVDFDTFMKRKKA